jgi:hypothetical protein
VSGIISSSSYLCSQCTDIEEQIAPQGPSLVSTTGKGESWSCAISWIKLCKQTHQTCNSLDPTAGAASRLVYVGQLDDFSDVRLVSRPTSGWDHHYTALSHCWGTTVLLKLQKSNIKDFEERIPFNELSQTFKDAVTATRELSRHFDVRHIWIDSLCIIQDSKNDWETEAAIMGHIYQTAFATFAATFGSNGNAGLFQSRSHSSLEPCRINAQWSQPTSQFTCEDRRPMMSSVTNSALCRRAWVLQERTLSSCILHFTAQQLFWECPSLTASEAYPSGLDKERGVGDYKTFSMESLKYTRGQGPFQTESFRPYQIWSTIVSRYSSCKLTKGSDKLVAVGSIAARLQAHFGLNDQYLGGIWKSQLPAQLLWTISGEPRPNHPTEYRAPSWSWASVDGSIARIQENSDYEAFHIKILNHDIEFARGNVALGVQKARLGIQGFICVLSRNYGLSLNDLDPDLYKLPKFPLEIVGIQDSTNMSCQFDTALGNFDNNRLYALAVASSKTGDSECMTGLMIKMTMKQVGEFERCGWFEITGAAQCQAVLNVARTMTLKQLEFESVNLDSGMYTISIV